MKISLNPQTNPTLEKSYGKWLSRKYPRGVPENFKPGPGTLAELAIHEDMCMATGKFDGEWLVCGNPLWNKKSNSPYYCVGCCKRLGIGPIPRMTKEDEDKLKGIMSRYYKEEDKKRRQA